MSDSLNVQLTPVLRQYVDMRAGGGDVYATPSEYIRDLIRKDRESEIVGGILQGIREAKQGILYEMTAMDIFNED